MCTVAVGNEYWEKVGGVQWNPGCHIWVLWPTCTVGAKPDSPRGDLQALGCQVWVFGPHVLWESAGHPQGEREVIYSGGVQVARPGAFGTHVWWKLGQLALKKAWHGPDLVAWGANGTGQNPWAAW